MLRPSCLEYQPLDLISKGTPVEGLLSTFNTWSHLSFFLAALVDTPSLSEDQKHKLGGVPMAAALHDLASRWELDIYTKPPNPDCWSALHSYRYVGWLCHVLIGKGYAHFSQASLHQRFTSKENIKALPLDYQPDKLFHTIGIHFHE